MAGERINGGIGPNIGGADRGGHDERRKLGIVEHAPIMPHLVAGHHAYFNRIRGKVLQNVVAEGRANLTDVSVAYGNAVEIPIRPHFTHIITRPAEATPLPPDPKIIEQVIYIGARREWISRSRGSDKLRRNQNKNLIRKLVVVVGLHVIDHPDGVVLHIGHRAVFLKHAKIGSDGQL